MKRIRLTLPLVLGLALAVGGTTAVAQTESFNEKFEFNGVTLGTVTDDGTIYAGSKQNGPAQNQRQFTNCSYFDENGHNLGYYPSDEFASTDPDAVREFCVANFENRNT